MLPELKSTNQYVTSPTHVAHQHQLQPIQQDEKPSFSHSQYGKRRSNILIEATKDFCRLDRPEDSDIYTFKEFFYQFVENLNIADKRVVAAMLARMNYTPRSIALYLSMETLEVAAPFLLFSPVLGESDLKAIGQKKGADYKRVMKRRRGETLAFVDFPELESEEVQKKSKPTVNDTDEALSEEKYISYPSQAEHPKQSGALSGDEIMALASAGGRLGRGKIQPTNNALIAEPTKTSITNEEASLDKLYAMARASDLTGFANAAAQMSGLDPNEILRLIKNENGDEIVYLVKALNFQATKDIQILMMICPRYGRQIAAYKTAKELLGQLDIGICQMIFNQVGADFKLQGAPTPTEIKGNRSDTGFARAVGERQDQISYNRAALTPRKQAREVFGRKAS